MVLIGLPMILTFFVVATLQFYLSFRPQQQMWVSLGLAMK